MRTRSASAANYARPTPRYGLWAYWHAAALGPHAPVPAQCMDAWYTSTFMKGDMTPAPCDDDFEDYQLCVVAAHREWMTGEKVIEDDDDAGD